MSTSVSLIVVRGRPALCHPRESSFRRDRDSVQRGEMSGTPLFSRSFSDAVCRAQSAAGLLECCSSLTCHRGLCLDGLCRLGHVFLLPNINVTCCKYGSKLQICVLDSSTSLEVEGGLGFFKFVSENCL